MREARRLPPNPPAGGYHLIKTIALPPAPGGAEYYDYITVDAAARRVYVSHGAEVVVLNADDYSVVGKIEGLHRCHGVALAPKLGEGFITDGDSRPGATVQEVAIFDLKTLKITGHVSTGQDDTDAIIYDPVSGHVFTFNGDSHNSTVIDPVKKTVITNIDLVGKVEFPAVDGKGMLYDNNPEKNDIVAIDTRTNAITVIASIAAGRKAAFAIMDRLGDKPETAPAETAAGSPSASLSSFNSSFLKRVPRAAAKEIHEAGSSIDAEESATPAWDAVEYEANRCFNCGCVAVSPSDLAPAFVALGARVKTTRRVLDAEEFFQARPGRSTILEPGELVEEVRVPPMSAGTRQAFQKFRLRKAIDFPIVNVATVVKVESGWVTEARIALGAVAPVPLRATKAEEYLWGRELSEEVARNAAELAVSECIPLGCNDYKISVLRALVARALLASSPRGETS